MVIVLVAEGMSTDRPHRFTVKLFDNYTDAESFIEKVNNPTDKYWTVAEIVENGEAVEPSREGFSLG